jgi:DNA-binding CsgD family transcriptional regulator
VQNRTAKATWNQRLRLLHIPCPRFIGREEELLWLQERLEEARRGQGELVFLAGEAGVGKTRLLGELIARGQQAEIRILEGRCSSFEATLPYAPFVEVFRGLVRGRTPSEIATLLGPYGPEVTRLLPELTQLLPHLQPNPALSPSAEKSRLFESLYQVLHGVAEDAPLILTLEDVHWADPASLELLHFIARRLRRDRWLVLATYRPEELPRAEALSHVRQDLLRERLAQDLPVAPLSSGETYELLTGVLGERAPASEALGAWIFQYGEGNPFFTEEILRTIVEASDEPFVNLDPATLSATAVPATVRETILARLEHLTVDVRHVLATAAVLGRTFDQETLQEASALAGEAFAAPFASLLSLQLVRPDRVPLRYGFRHHLIREVVAQHLAPDIRRRLHQRVGELLEARGSPTVTPQMLTHHFQEAGDRERIVRYARAAAAEASAVYSHKEAAEYLTLALTALPATETRARLEVAESLGDAWLRAKQYDRAVQIFAEARDYAAALDLRLETARAYRKIGVAENERHCGSGFGAWEKGLALLADIDAPAEEAAIRAQTSEAAFMTGQYARGEAEARAGATAAERSGEPGVLGRCYRSLGINLAAQGHRSEARDCMDKAVTLAREAKDPEAEALALMNAGFYAMQAGEFGAARPVLEKAHVLAEKIGAIACSENIVLDLAELSLLEGKWDEAEALSAESLARLEEWQRPFPFGFAAYDLACVHLLRGRFDEAEALLHQARKWASTFSGAQTLIPVLTALAQLERRRGNSDAARTWLEQALALSRESGHAGWATAEALLVLAETCVQTGGLAGARARLEAAVQASRAFPYLAPRVCRIRGLVAQGVSLDEAIRHFEAGLGSLAAAPQPYEEALLRYHLALCLLRRNRIGDHKAARSHLGDALAIVERLGARPDVELVRHALGRIRGRVPAGHALTAREREVLALLAEGLSNAAIAGRLYLSERTIEVHVSHILHKLMLESRSQLAAWVAKHGNNPPPAESVH